MQNPYHIKIAPLVCQQMAKLAPKHQKAVIKAIETMAINPRPPGVAKIEGMSGLYAQEVSPVRIIYKIEEQEVLVLVVK